MLAKSIDETRSVLGVTTETAEEQEKAVETVKSEEENKVVAATKLPLLHLNRVPYPFPTTSTATNYNYT